MPHRVRDTKLPVRSLAHGATTACKLVENKQYSQDAPFVGGFIFFGNGFGAKAFLPVWM
jgi:hypothetical protein